jgi:hypothetical protein
VFIIPLHVNLQVNHDVLQGIGVSPASNWLHCSSHMFAVSLTRCMYMQDDGVLLASNQIQYSLYLQPERNSVTDAIRDAGATLIAYSPPCARACSPVLFWLCGLALKHKHDAAVAYCSEQHHPAHQQSRWQSPIAAVVLCS